jgi:hypothetical protein
MPASTFKKGGWGSIMSAVQIMFGAGIKRRSLPETVVRQREVRAPT